MYTHIVACICVRFFTSQHAHLGFIGIAEYLFYVVLVVAVVMVFYDWKIKVFFPGMGKCRCMQRVASFPGLVHLSPGNKAIYAKGIAPTKVL